MSRNWKTVLGYTPQNTAKTIDAKFKKQALKSHPNKGGNRTVWNELTAARAAAKTHFATRTPGTLAVRSQALVPYKPNRNSDRMALAPYRPPRQPPRQQNGQAYQAYMRGYARGFSNASERAKMEAMAAQTGGRRGRLWAWYQRSEAVKHARDLGWILRNMGLGKRSLRPPRNAR